MSCECSQHGERAQVPCTFADRPDGWSWGGGLRPLLCSDHACVREGRNIHTSVAPPPGSLLPACPPICMTKRLPAIATGLLLFSSVQFAAEARHTSSRPIEPARATEQNIVISHYTAIIPAATVMCFTCYIKFSLL